MVATRTRSTIVLGIALIGLALTISGCKKPPVVQGAGTAVSQNGVSASVSKAELIRPEFEGLRGAVVSERPMLQLTLEVTNQTDGPLNYDLGWNQTVATQSQSVVVFVGSDPETDVSETNQVASVDLADVEYLEDPVTEVTTVAAGNSLTDKILFEKPPEGTTSLLVSIPPALFPDSDMPGYIVLPWEPNEVDPLPSVAVGEMYEDSEFSLKVTDVTTEWVRLTNASDEVGITNDPLMKIAFTLTNNTEEPVTYRPTRERGAVAFPTLLQPDGNSVPRATFDSAVKVNGQKDSRVQVGPGESIEDFMLFQRPPEGVGQLSFIFPGKRIGASGQARVDVDYTYTTPQKPADWRPPEEDSEDDE
jgi:hypothetical protein